MPTKRPSPMPKLLRDLTRARDAIATFQRYLDNLRPTINRAIATIEAVHLLATLTTPKHPTPPEPDKDTKP